MLPLKGLAWGVKSENKSYLIYLFNGNTYDVILRNLHLHLIVGLAQFFFTMLKPGHIVHSIATPVYLFEMHYN